MNVGFAANGPKSHQKWRVFWLGSKHELFIASHKSVWKIISFCLINTALQILPSREDENFSSKVLRKQNRMIFSAIDAFCIHVNCDSWYKSNLRQPSISWLMMILTIDIQAEWRRPLLDFSSNPLYFWNNCAGLSSISNFVENKRALIYLSKNW